MAAQDGALTAPAGHDRRCFEVLALAATGDRNRAALEGACERLGLAVTDVDREVLPQEATTALRLPVGLAVLHHARGRFVRLAAPPATWFAALPPAVTGRRLQVVTVDDLLREEPSLGRLCMVKLAGAKHRGLTAARVDGLAAAREAVRRAGLPGRCELLVADEYLDCDSEYRTFTVGRGVVASSPYLVEGEGWSRELTSHRASFHREAADLVADVLRELPDAQVPPACVLDVARLPDGRLHLLEANTAWGAGLYGCDPDGVLQAVLAANGPCDDAWAWRPDAGMLELAGR